MANRRKRTTAQEVTETIRNDRRRHLGFEKNGDFQNIANRIARKGRDSSGQFMTRGDRNAFAALARANAQNQRTNNYDYTKPSNYSHDARYRNIRRAFGMSAG